MLHGDFLRPFEQLGAVLSGELSEALQKIVSIVADFADADSLFCHLEETYVSLFITHKEGIVAPLYQSCYEFKNAPMMGPSAIMMKQRLESKGLSLTNHLHEPPDHLAIELEYLYFLMEKGWSDNNDDFIDEASSFASKIMLPWVTEFQQRITTKRQFAFFYSVATILCALLNCIGAFNRSQMGAESFPALR